MTALRAVVLLSLAFLPACASSFTPSRPPMPPGPVVGSAVRRWKAAASLYRKRGPLGVTTLRFRERYPMCP
jgi:hypothetical protein